ncbi:hypothetical protein [Longimicrobium sp.]|uniref:hypothetical protein n=1 Tax=Longimicrobium sp. TaxID=2029185 RepID=UPI003B3B14B7
MPSRIPEGTPPRVLIRDFLIFQAKTFIDGLKDVVVIPFATILFALDLIFGKGDKRGRTFYALMGACESFDRWMNLYRPASQAGGSAEGLFAGSEPGDGTMMGDIEGLMRRNEPARSAQPSVPAAF